MPEPDREPSPRPAAGAANEVSTSSQHRSDHVDELAAPSHPFEPLFTLLANSTTNTTIHPRIHYLFSDDDPSILAHASAADDPSHRPIVVDLAPAPSNDSSRWSISWASSLSPDFAVTSSQVAIQHAEGDSEADGGALMLRLEGVEREPVEFIPDSLPASGSGALGREDVEGMVEDFRRRMGTLRKVVDEGAKRRETVARQEEMIHHDMAETGGAEGGRNDSKEEQKEGE